MTAPTNPGTAVASQRERKGDDGLTREGRMHMAQIRATRALTVAITNEAWGNALTPQMRYAVAEYMRRFRLDVGEVDILGGKIYKNGYYYRRRMAEMRSKGLIEWSDGEHIGPNAQLNVAAAQTDDEELATWAKSERSRRLKERIRWEVPEDATHAYVVRVKLVGDKNPLEGCDWITPLRVRKVKKWANRQVVGTEDKIADPIGAEEPEKTVITRAWRRCGILVAAEIPELKQEEETMEAEAEVVETTVATIKASDDEREAYLSREPGAVQQSPDPADPYQLGAGPVASVPFTEQRFVDPAPIAEPVAAKPASNGYKMHFGGEYVGKPIANVPTAELQKLLTWAMKNGRHAEFVERASVELDERRYADEDELPLTGER